MAVTDAVGLSEVTLTITTAAGSGTADFQAGTVRIDTIFFSGPATATFNYSIADRNSRGVTGASGLAVSTSLVVERICIGRNTLTISGASLDGDYTATLRLTKSY